MENNTGVVLVEGNFNRGGEGSWSEFFLDTDFLSEFATMGGVGEGGWDVSRQIGPEVRLSQKVEKGFEGPNSYIRRTVGMGGLGGAEMSVSATMDIFTKRKHLFSPIEKIDCVHFGCTFSEGITNVPQGNIRLTVYSDGSYKVNNNQNRDEAVGVEDHRVQNAARLIEKMFGVNVIGRDVKEVKKELFSLIARARRYDSQV